MSSYSQLTFWFDQSKCTGCAACSIACKDKHDLPVGVSWRRITEYTGGGWLRDGATGTVTNDVFSYYTSISCNHCDDPICANVCPTTAMSKGENGVVTVDPDVCIGCKYCAMACPYSAPQYNPEAGVMTKCDFCADRIAVGEDPACVAACPSRALGYGERDEVYAEHGDQNAVEPLPDPSITQPNLSVTAHPRAQASGRGAGQVANYKEA